jgi:two-component system, NarL family, sensor kinase
MFQSDEEIYITIVITTYLMIFLVVIIVISIVKYQNKLKKHIEEVNLLKNLYQQEILKAQLEMQEQTFLTISQEIHDNIGQILSLTRLNISTIKIEDQASTIRKIATSKELLDKAIDDLRDLSKRLNIEYLSQQSLSELLKFQLNIIEKTGLYTTFLEVNGEEYPLNAGKKLIVFRIAQEALNNTIKHAKAENISITLDYLPDKIILGIKDDGKGFGSGIPQTGIGIHNMYHRAKLIGADFSLQSRIDKGTIAKLILHINS